MKIKGEDWAGNSDVRLDPNAIAQVSLVILWNGRGLMGGRLISSLRIKIGLRGLLNWIVSTLLYPILC